MTEDEVKTQAFAMPLTSPAFPCGPYRFVDREYLIITYRTDPDALRAVIPAPLEMAEAIVKYEFIRMPDSTGFGDYTESGQVIPVTFQGRRELWGFPKKLASPKLTIEKDTLLGVLRYGPVPVAVGTMGYKHRALPHDEIHASLSTPNYLLKIIPHVDGTPRICEIVRYFCEDVTVKGAWDGPAALGVVSPRTRAGGAIAGVGSDLWRTHPVRSHARTGYCSSRLPR